MAIRLPDPIFLKMRKATRFIWGRPYQSALVYSPGVSVTRNSRRRFHWRLRRSCVRISPGGTASMHYHRMCDGSGSSDLCFVPQHALQQDLLTGRRDGPEELWRPSPAPIPSRFFRAAPGRRAPCGIGPASSFPSYIPIYNSIVVASGHPAKWVRGPQTVGGIE
jgi:hypothetical protein